MKLKKTRKTRYKLIASILTATTLIQLIGSSSAATIHTEASKELLHTNTAQTDPAQPEIVREDVTKRGAYEKHYEKSDGSYVASSYSDQTHYQNEKGLWEEIDNSLEALVENGREVLKNKEGLIDVSFNTTLDGEVGSIQSGDYTLRWNMSAKTSEMEKSISLANPKGKALDELKTSSKKDQFIIRYIGKARRIR